MSCNIYITPAAINDIDEAVNYYNEKVTDLGFKFADDVDDNFTAIAQNPNAFTERYNNVRDKLLRRFPYLILYKTNHNTQNIEVIRLFNTYQNPYWGKASV